MNDLISRQEAIDALHMHLMYRMGTDSNKKRLDDLINGVPSAEPRWIPFKARELTDEEKEEHPELCFIFDCQMPEDGQRILVSIDCAGHERVQLDEFYEDDGIYLDSGYEIGREAVAWMPLPEPYEDKKNERSNFMGRRL